MKRSMDENIAEIRWVVQDVVDAFKDEFNREPSDNELDSILNELNTDGNDGIQERGISAGWDVINDFMSDRAHEIIDEVHKEEVQSNIRASSGHIYSYSPFGFEGALITVETDLRRGIPAVDIVGLSDGSVKENRERAVAAIRNSGFTFPPDRVLISLSPADLRKEGAGFDLPLALDIIKEYNANSSYTKDPKFMFHENVMVIGELELSGRVRAVKGVLAAVETAKAAGITNVICPSANLNELIGSVDGVKIAGVDSLEDAVRAIYEPALFKDIKEYSVENTLSDDSVHFSNDNFIGNISDLHGNYVSCKAIETAIAGKHNLLLVGSPGSGKTIAIQELVPYLTPDLTSNENYSHRRIWSLAGLTSSHGFDNKPPFRIPHQTASIEGICGGGPNCRPGEISLAHNGILFLDEAAEFRSSVLQMLRVPLENNSITLSRAGRSTTYPAKFQLMMAANPCPCGNYGSHSKICLDSAKSIDMYWKKFSEPLLDRVAIKCYTERDEEDTRKFDLKKARERIKKAFEIQRKRGVYNNDLTEQDLEQLISFDEKDRDAYRKITQRFELSNSKRTYLNMLRVSVTVANMDGREKVLLKDIKEAVALCQNHRDVIELHPAQDFYKEKEKTQEQGREGR